MQDIGSDSRGSDDWDCPSDLSEFGDDTDDGDGSSLASTFSDVADKPAQ